MDPGTTGVRTKAQGEHFSGLLVLACSFPPFINSFDNPRVAMLHGLDVFRLLAAGSMFGFGLARVISGLFIFRSK